VRGIVLDIGGVLQVGRDGREPTLAFDGLLAAWERRLGVADGALVAHLVALAPGGLVGAYDEAAFHDGLRVTFGLDQGTLATFLADFWDVYLGEPNVELVRWLRRRRGAQPTALLSNSFVGARAETARRFGAAELADVVVYSHEEGVAKPEPRIYAIACERLRCAPADLLFLDDMPAYVEGANAAGLRGVRYENAAQAIAALEGWLHAGGAASRRRAVGDEA
jgi:FMN phosphatase YigB (HAD superfamily)